MTTYFVWVANAPSAFFQTNKMYPRIDKNWHLNWRKLSLINILSIWNQNISFSSPFPAKAQKKCSKLKRQSSFIWKPSIPSSLPRALPLQSRSFLSTLNSSFPTRHATSFAKPSLSPSALTTAGPVLSKLSIHNSKFLINPLNPPTAWRIPNPSMNISFCFAYQCDISESFFDLGH